MIAATRPDAMSPALAPPQLDAIADACRQQRLPCLNDLRLGLAERGALIAVAKIDRLARDAGFVLKRANATEKTGMGGLVFCDLPDIDPTTSAGRMVLTLMASVAEFQARRISERSREALAAAKERGVRLGGSREVAVRQSAPCPGGADPAAARSGGKAPGR